MTSVLGRAWVSVWCSAATAGLAAFILLAATPSGASVAPMVQSGGSIRFVDPVGDSGDGPDIAAVSVQNDDAGLITWRISVPNRSRIAPGESLVLAIDADANVRTGDFGKEFRLVVFDRELEYGNFERWTGVTWLPYPNTPPFPPRFVVVRFDPGRLVVAVNRARIGVAGRLSFQVLTSETVPEDDPARWRGDEAPALDGVWTFGLGFTPKAAAAVLRPKPPVAGKALAVSVRVVADGKPVATATVTCTAKLAAKAARPSTTSFRNSTATCTLPLPKAAKGTTIAGKITVKTGGGAVSKAFTARIR